MSILLSPKAQERIKNIYKENPEKIVIFSMKKTGCSGFEYTVNIGTMNRETTLEIHNGLEVGIATDYLDQFENTLIDYSEDKFESKFVFNNPNVKSMCGCGSSVNF